MHYTFFLVAVPGRALLAGRGGVYPAVLHGGRGDRRRRAQEVRHGGPREQGRLLRESAASFHLYSN